MPGNVILEFDANLPKEAIVFVDVHKNCGLVDRIDLECNTTRCTASLPSFSKLSFFLAVGGERWWLRTETPPMCKWIPPPCIPHLFTVYVDLWWQYSWVFSDAGM